MIKLSKFLGAFSVLALTSCAMTPVEVVGASSAILCQHYGNPGSPNYLDPNIKEELQRRGQADCISPEMLLLRESARANSMQILNLSNQLLNMGSRRPVQPVYPNSFSNTRNCTSQVQGNQLVTRCY